MTGISLDLAGASRSPDLARPLVPPGVFLYVGAGGGGPGTDLYVSMVESVYKSAGVPVQTDTKLPPNFAAQFGVMELLNPMAAVPADVSNAAMALLGNGGRVVVVMEHCKNGCYGDATDDNAFLAGLGSTMRLSGMGGAPLAETTLQLTPVSRITDGVTTLIVYYTGSVNVGSGIVLGRVPNGDAIIGYERVGAGDVVVVADSDPFGYVMAKGDDATFVANLAKLR